jgi:hypothetical protein
MTHKEGDKMQYRIETFEENEWRDMEAWGPDGGDFESVGVAISEFDYLMALWMSAYDEGEYRLVEDDGFEFIVKKHKWE